MFIQLNFLKIFIILLLKILITVQVDPIFYNTDPSYIYFLDESLDSYKTLLLEIMHGKMPFKIESNSDIIYDIDFIERINGNFNFPYMLKSLELYEKKNGIFLGCGINLLYFDPEEMESILQEARMNFYDIQKIKSFCKVSGNDAKLMLNNKINFIFDIRRFNVAVINYLIKNRDNIFPKNKDNLKTPFINALLSLYIQLGTISPQLKGNFFTNYTSASYITKYLFEGAPFARFIQSKLILMIEGNIKFNNNHLIFVVPMIFEEKEKLEIKTFITEYSRILNNNIHLNKNKISILTFNNEVKNYIINYNSRKSRQLDSIFEFNKKEMKSFNLTNIYEYLFLLFEEIRKTSNENIYENDIVALFLDINIAREYKEVINNVINEYKKKGIQTIPYINKPDSKRMHDIINYNIFYNFSKTFEIAPLRIAVSNMHIYIDLTDENVNLNNNNILKKLENLKMNDMDAPIYIEVNIIKEENEFVFYEIELEIKETQGYNIFLSDNNPYPNIKDYTSKFIKYDNNFNPKLRIKTNSLNQFYISIEGIIYFNLTIKKDYTKENEELILSEGEYEKESFNIPIIFTDETIRNLETFTSDYKPKLYSNILKEDSSLDYVIKYFTRGIDLDNTEYNSFFDYNLFTYLYGDSYMIKTIYRNPDTNKYYIGRYLELNRENPFTLMDNGLNQLIINKLYDFINENNRTLDEKNLPAISFNEQEIKLIYNITNGNYINKIANLLNKTSNTMNFKDLSSEIKFLIFCLYFQNSKENLGYIKNLAQKEPKYPDILKSLSKEKNDDKANRFIISSILSFDQQIKFEKILITIIAAQSFILSDVGVNCLKDFYNVLSKAKAKISLSVYDTIKNKIKTIIPFYSKRVTKIEIIDEYKKENEGIRYKYNETKVQKMDFNKIINFGLNHFSKYDAGIKKELLIISEEHLYTNDSYYINNILTNLNYKKHEQLRKNQIKLILLSTKNAEKGDIPELFTLPVNKNEIKPYTINENYFHVNSFVNTDIFINDLGKMAKDALTKLNLGTRLINDFYQGKITYYEINCENLLDDIIVIKANLSNFGFYYSFDNPFPNQYMDFKADKIADDDKVVISDLSKRDKVYLGLESKNEVKKQIIEVFSCEIYYSKKQYKNCKFVENNRFLWYGFFLLVAIFIIGLAVYYFGHSNDKTQINIFEQQ